jgi:FlaA1/EpsC-like NDP-sugar epimerase
VRAPKPLPTALIERLQRRSGLAFRLLHVIGIASSLAVAWGLGVALSGELPEIENLMVVSASLIAAKTLVAELFRLHRASWRWFGLADAAAITVANTSGSVLGALILGPRLAAPALGAILVTEWLASQALLLGSRMLFRLLQDARERRPIPHRRRVMIYGAGRSGVNLMRRIHANPLSVYEIVGFVDDDSQKRHTMIQMNPVLGNGEELPRLARLHEVEEILVAVGNHESECRRRFRELARTAGLRFRFPRRAVASARSPRDRLDWKPISEPRA